jgi:hypothetical protein
MKCTPMSCMTHEMHVRKVLGNLQVSHLTNGGAVVDLSRSELQNTSLCAKEEKVLIGRRTSECRYIPCNNSDAFEKKIVKD